MGLRILVVEDDHRLATLLAAQLGDLGHTLTLAHDGQAAIAKIADQAFDAIVLDRMLPLLDGVSVIENLRAANVGTPILMLTALGQTIDKVEGLGAGADDYVVKPADPAEIDARLKALVRARQWQGGGSDTIRVGDLTISPARVRAHRGDRDLDLPKTEFNLLLELARNAGSVLTRPMLLERVWGYDFEPTTNIVDAYIRRLRVKLTQFGGDDPIVTLRGVGYMLRDG